METKLDGKWQMVRAEMAGESAPDLMVDRTEMRLVDGAYEVWFGGERSDRGTYREDAAVDGLRTMELVGGEGTNAGRTIPCIFQLMGDRLRVCFGFNGRRPDEFTTRPGDERYLATYRRILSE